MFRAWLTCCEPATLTHFVACLTAIKTFKNRETLHQTKLKGPRSHYPAVYFAETQKMPFKIPVCAPFIHVTGLINLCPVKKRSASNTLIYYKLTQATVMAPLELHEWFICVNTVCKQKLPGPELSSAHLCHSVWRVIA